MSGSPRLADIRKHSKRTVEVATPTSFDQTVTRPAITGRKVGRRSPVSCAGYNSVHGGFHAHHSDHIDHPCHLSLSGFAAHAEAHGVLTGRMAARIAATLRENSAGQIPQSIPIAPPTNGTAAMEETRARAAHSADLRHKTGDMLPGLTIAPHSAGNLRFRAAF